MTTKQNRAVVSFKAAVGVVGAIIFLIAGIVVAAVARRYQLSGEPMPNGKGGFMTFRDGYWIASVLFALSVGWFVSARRFLRSR